MNFIKIIFSLLFLNCYSQEINGKYQWLDPSGLSYFSYEFKNVSFTSNYGTDIGIKLKSKGYYMVIKDTLIVIHDNPINKQIQIIEQSDKKDSLGVLIKNTQIDFNVFFDNETVALGAKVILKDDKKNTLKGFLVNKEGNMKLSLSETTNVESIIIAHLNDQIELNIKDYLYKCTKLKIILSLKNWKYYDYRGIDKYKISHEKGKKIKLTNLKTNEIFILIKEK